MVRALARKLDAAVFNGTGATGTPLGMKNTGGINSESWSGFSVGFADQDVTTHLENMIGKLEDADAYMGSLGWAMSPATRRCLMRAVDANNRPLFFSTRGLGSAPNGEAGAGTGRGPGSGEFYGHPYATSTQLAGGAAGDLIFADFSTVLIGMFSTIIVETSREAGDAFRTNQTLVKAYMEADIGIQHAEAICIANSLDTTTVAA
jgi:HK97 family phage major capsid protein